MLCSRQPNIPGHFRDNGYLTFGGVGCDPAAWNSVRNVFDRTRGGVTVQGKLWHEDSGAWNADNAWTSTAEGGLPYYPYASGRCPHGGEGGGHCQQEDEQIFDWRLMNHTVNSLDFIAQEAYDVHRCSVLLQRDH